MPDYFPLWAKKRIELSIPLEAYLLISVGELNANKNNSAIISAMEKLKNENLYYILCGVGEKRSDLQKQADKADLHNNVRFLGYRSDVKELYEAADCFVMPSFREGLSRSIMEAMASGLPCVVSKIRGNSDLIIENKGGFLCKPSDVDGFATALQQLCEHPELHEARRKYNLERIKNFDIKKVKDEMKKIYKEILN